MIDFSQIKNPEYVHSLINDIHSTDDLITLNNLVKNISSEIHNKKVSYEDIAEILIAIKNRRNSIVVGQRNNRGHNRTKSLTLSPVGSNNNNRTAISDSRGVASLIFIIVNIAITTIMYTLLLIANFIK